RAGVARRGLDRLYREEWCRGLDRLPEQSSIRGRRWIDNHCNALCRKQVSCPGYVAHELSGFIASPEGLDEPDDMVKGPKDAEVSGCFEPLGAQGAIGDGGWRAFGMLGAAVPAVPPALRGGWACRAGRSPARQGVAASGAGGQAGVDAGRIPHA